MSIARTAMITLGVAGLLLAGVYGNSFRNHYQPSVDEHYAPQPATLPEGYESYLIGEGSEDIELLKLGQAAGFTFYQYTEDNQVYHFRLKDGSSFEENMESAGLSSVDMGMAAEHGITFTEEVGDQTIMAWFPGEYGEDSKGSKPFVVSYVTDTDEFNAVSNPFHEPSVFSPFHQFRYEVTSANGTINDLWLPAAQPVELTL